MTRTRIGCHPRQSTGFGVASVRYSIMEAVEMSGQGPFPVLDPASVEPRRGSGYPGHLRDAFMTREKRGLGDPLGLTNFGVNLVPLPPGSGSALRHWHTSED